MGQYTLQEPEGFDRENPEHQAQLNELIKRVEESGARKEELRDEEKRRFNTTLGATEGGLEQDIQAMAAGGLDTLLAGTPEAAAVKSGVPEAEFQLMRQQHPISTSVGEIGGSLLPLGKMLKGGQLVKSLIGGQAAKMFGKGAVREGAAEGARMGATYGAGEAVSSEVKRGNEDLGEVVAEGAKGAGKGFLVGGSLGTIGGYLSSNSKNVLQLADDAEKQFFQALKFGNRGEGDAAKYQQDIQRSLELVGEGEQGKITDLNQLVDAGQKQLDARMGEVDAALSAEGKRGLRVGGDELTTDYIRNAVFPQSYLKQLDSNEVGVLNEQINQLLRLKDKNYPAGTASDNLARQLLSNKGFFSTIPPETRTKLVNIINSSEGISGDALLAEGLTGLRQSTSGVPGFDPGLNLPNEALSAIVGGTEKFGNKGKKWTPWELEDRIEKINDEVADIERKLPQPQTAAQVASNPQVAMLRNEQNVLRTKLDEVMSPGPNGEFREQKRDIGSLMRLRRVATAAQLAEKEGKGTKYSAPIKGAVERIGRGQNIVGSVARAIKTDRDLSPSERIKKGFELWLQSKKQPPRLVGRKGEGARGGALLEGIVKKSPVTRTYSEEVAD